MFQMFVSAARAFTARGRGECVRGATFTMARGHLCLGFAHERAKLRIRLQPTFVIARQSQQHCVKRGRRGANDDVENEIIARDNVLQQCRALRFKIITRRVQRLRVEVKTKFVNDNAVHGS